MQLKRKILNQIKGDPKLQKALAIALLIKIRLGRSGLLKNWTINKLHSLTNISSVTLNKYIPILIDLGWITFSGIDNNHLVVRKLSSHTDNRNIKIDKFCFDSFSSIYHSLRAFVVLILQSHKDFLKRTLQEVANPTSGKKYKAARKLVRSLVKKGILKSVQSKYKEFGLSYKRIAKETGNCIKTAQGIIRFAISKGWVIKERHQEQIHLKDVGSFESLPECYTFVTRNNIYLIHANTYNISPSILKDISLVG